MPCTIINTNILNREIKGYINSSNRDSSPRNMNYFNNLYASLLRASMLITSCLVSLLRRSERKTVVKGILVSALCVPIELRGVRPCRS